MAHGTVVDVEPPRQLLHGNVVKLNPGKLDAADNDNDDDDDFVDEGIGWTPPPV